MEAGVATVSSLAVYNHRRRQHQVPGPCRQPELINHHQQQGAVAPDAALPANQLLGDQSWKFLKFTLPFDTVILSYTP